MLGYAFILSLLTWGALKLAGVTGAVTAVFGWAAVISGGWLLAFFLLAFAAFVGLVRWK